jgi:enterochelin esterase-like enzyme
MRQDPRRSVSVECPGVAAACVVILACIGVLLAFAQEPPRPAQPPAPTGRGGMQAPQFVSPEVATDGRVTFRIFAPRAQAVRLSAGDIPGMTPTPGGTPANTQLTKADNGVWELTVGPLDPGAYRYNFNVDGVATIDPRNPAISESNNNVWSLVCVPGSDVFDTKDVPRGAVAAVTYKSTALGYFRRMHIYTPPGYELGRGQYPVFYLLHGAGDNDDAWSSVGRAGFILDNLIAAKKARPMIVVMPAGHTSRGPGGPGGPMSRSATEDFVNDFVKDVMPYLETHYRVLKDRANTAIAGLSMGGSQTLAVAIPRLERFGYIGVFSSGLIGAFPELAGRGGRGVAVPAPTAPAAPTAPTTPPGRAAAAPGAAMPAMPTAAEWETENAATLDNPKLKQGLRLLWFGTGKDDSLITTTQATVGLFKKHGFKPVFKETPGGHTWVNWRNYLAEVAPQLFQTAK